MTTTTMMMVIIMIMVGVIPVRRIIEWCINRRPTCFVTTIIHIRDNSDSIDTDNRKMMKYEAIGTKWVMYRSSSIPWRHHDTRSCRLGSRHGPLRPSSDKSATKRWWMRSNGTHPLHSFPRANNYFIRRRIWSIITGINETTWFTVLRPYILSTERIIRDVGPQPSHPNEDMTCIASSLSLIDKSSRDETNEQK